jgi:hypothetical protein
MLKDSLVIALARAFMAGEQTLEKVVLRGSWTLDRPWRGLHGLAERYLEAFAGRARPREKDVVQFLYKDSYFRQHGHRLRVDHWITGPQPMQPVAAAEAWDVRPIETAGDLAAWLQIDIGELEWFADRKGLGYKKNRTPLRHYYYRPLVKRSGSFRLIEAPKTRLKQIQRRILSEILDKIPAHPAAHGFVTSRSIRTFAAPHAGRRVVLRMDLKNFFPTFTPGRIQASFRTVGYPESVADLLAGICTNAAPRDAWHIPGFEGDPHELWEASNLYSYPHLPQGAPTSPAIANICSYRMDCRMAGLARRAGGVYTRYADDLAFSGDDIDWISPYVAAIVEDEGFTVNHRKTRIMRQGVRQRLAGIVVNQGMNIIRPDFDLLKAILTNCVRSGPESQNREGHADFRAHLQGRVGFVEMIHAVKGARLRAIFDRIAW